MNETYCQSCAMPLGVDKELYGTEANGEKNTDYCSYCYENGKFTSEITMDEMIELCVTHMPLKEMGTTEDAARAMMQETFPKMKRWN